MCKIILVFCTLQSVTVFCSVLLKDSEMSRIKQPPYFKYTVDALLHNVFPKKTSDDLYLDPCKAGEFLGDIAVPVSEQTLKLKIKKAALQEEVKKYEQEVLARLQIEKEGLTDDIDYMIGPKKTKQAIPIAASKDNDTFDSLSVDTSHNNGQILKPIYSGDALSKETPNVIITKSIKIENKTGGYSFNERPTNYTLNVNNTEQNAAKSSHHETEENVHKRKKTHENQRWRRNRQKVTKHSILSHKSPIHEFEPNFDFKRKNLVPFDRPHSPHRRVTRAATARKERLWDYGVIPYEIDANFSGMDRALFKQAMKHWENFTCVKFVERNRDEHQNYILFTVRPCGCCSFVGKKGDGVQAISIGKNCDKFGIVVHELGHVVGFWHEHTRPDREKHVNIITNNIMTGQEYNFNKLDEDEVNSMGSSYDYDSIMHYARNTFSKGTYLDTIEPIHMTGQTRPEIGQRIRLSEGDIAQANLLYKCPKCGRTYQESSATFSAPIYSDDIPEEGIKCEWRITGTHGEKIVLNITDLDTEKSQDCKTDYIEVRDGYWHKSKILGLFCGTGQFHHIVSNGSRMLITYVAKNPKGHRGFTASYAATCGGDLTIDTEGHLESPNYPDEYLPNKECIWRITVTENHQVALRFQSFDVENHDRCVYDYVEVRDGLSLRSPIRKVFCGQELPPNIISTSNEMFVKFVSDGSVQKGGFSATIKTEYDECSKIDHGCEQQCVNTPGSYVCACRIGFELHSDGKHCEDACGGVFDVSNGTIISPSFPDLYPLNKSCVWEIIASPQYRITLNFTHFDLEGNNFQPQHCEFDKVDIFSKLKDDELKKHGSYCGSIAPGLITSEGNVMRIVFYSDTSIQKTGFSAIFITDLDECALNRGGCQHECIDTLGSYICTCNNGYILHENGRDCKEGDCRYEITALHGSVSSPNYPDYYPARKDCVWHFITTPGHRIRLSFQTFDLEPHEGCSYDYLDLYDGPSPESPLLGTFCGSNRPHLTVSSGHQLYMAFRSDASIHRNGFWATHTTVCGGMLQATQEKQHIYSHAKFGRASYENRVACEWTIEATFGYNVKLSFLTFDIEDEKDCGYDYVEIFNGLDSSGPSYGRYCGTMKPFDIISTYEQLLVRFRTDDSLVRDGFSLVYEAVEFSYSEEEI